ncbi:type II toxin-antitoxin system RelE/ParE family toxin [Pseudolabrys taiwanensis]|uniref:Type II toxin-antitoxin system RelE/ParE family toxin n=1 Tax=Pseudolabrys taiwanensis TaxID=331696 RepID=A0A345ZRJ6_9HYPH|nr:type II toxin-antitoxin system RelE/ParE family toxin [Pseudolabrys taiwanensis]AXK79543.1 type II toxin-antitoxin system RelE/ParE family toxin [Pseudolabrys taiwanensis]
MIVVVTDEAAFDLERIGDAIAQDNPTRAITFVRELRLSCESLGEFPKAYPLVPRYEDSGVRRRVHGNYLIFYRIGIDTVDVLHVLHGAMDYAALLFPEG